MSLTAAEQYNLELINRARLDPLAEAERYGIDLNVNLAPGTISSSSKQVLAQNDLLSNAAHDHSVWMLNNNRFTHDYADPDAPDGINDPGYRIREAGYVFQNAWAWGENLSWRGTTGTINLNTAIDSHHRGLFLSEGHRANMMGEVFREIGVGQVKGDYTHSNGVTYDSSMMTHKFAKTGTDVFLTGVVFNDLDADDFYTIGEGRGGAVFTAGGLNDTTVSSGGYAIGVAAAANRLVEVTHNDGLDASLRLDMSGGNAKLDYLVGEALVTSVSATIVSGVEELRLLGVEDLSLTGDSAANTLIGNKGGNALTGGGGGDTLEGGEGDDALAGDGGADSLDGGSGADDLDGGEGADSLNGGAGTDTLDGGEGDDTLDGGDNADTLDGGNGSDFYLADAFDFVEDTGSEGFDVVQVADDVGSLGALGLTGIERVLGTTGDDVIDVTAWSGTLEFSGDEGSDHLSGGDSDEILLGGDGADTVDGGGGHDILLGDDITGPIDVAAVFGTFDATDFL